MVVHHQVMSSVENLRREKKTPSSRSMERYHNRTSSDERYYPETAGDPAAVRMSYIMIDAELYVVPSLK